MARRAIRRKTRPDELQRLREPARVPRRAGPLIVLDASAALDLIFSPRPPAAIERALRGETVHVPAIFDAETYAVVRRELRRGRLSEREGLGALFHIRRLTAARHALSPLLLEAFGVRDRFGAHDVFYAVLARRLGATLVTSDVPLSRACAGYVPVRLVDAGGTPQ